MASEWREVASRAYEAFDAGNLKEAAVHFDELLRLVPDDPGYHYMKGLAHKYMRDWNVSLQHNLRSQALRSEPDEASIWNAGIAATALGDWVEARRQWESCGVKLPKGDGPIEANFGIVGVRLNPWGNGETLFARRIDPVRARLLNVPMPPSGFQCLDLVLHDGASTGTRTLADGQEVPVFNVMERLEPSDFKTYTAFVTCEDPKELAPLGVVHRHDKKREEKDWSAERSIGIAAQSRQSVTKILDKWKGKKRYVDGIESREFPISAPPDGVVWWRLPEEDEQSEDSVPLINMSSELEPLIPS